MEKFDKKQYDIDYRKKHKVQFNVDLNKEEMNSLQELLKVIDIKKVDFLRNAIRSECRKNNILYFDRVSACDWCGEKKDVSICHYGTSHYNRLVCKDCAENIVEHHRLLDGSTPSWYRPEED